MREYFNAVTHTLFRKVSIKRTLPLLLLSGLFTVQPSHADIITEVKAVDFGNVPVLVTASQTFRIAATGLPAYSVSIGTSGTGFSQTNDCPSTLEIGQICTI